MTGRPERTSLMKSVLGKSSVKKTMRVATAFTGVAAGVAIFAPAAQAAPDNTPVPQPYKIWVDTASTVQSLQVCGWKDVGTGKWTCTAIEHNPNFDKVGTANYMGANWKRGKVNVWMFDFPGGSKAGHTCNTNGSYSGSLRTGGVSLFGNANFASLGFVGSAPC
jgi:hypothetical protein